MSTPADVVKTRVMKMAEQKSSESTGMLRTGYKILNTEGAGALYKGFIPICTRKLIWCTAFFVTYERVKAAAVQAFD